MLACVCLLELEPVWNSACVKHKTSFPCWATVWLSMCVWTLFIWHTCRCQIFYLSVAMLTHSAAFSFGFVDTLHGQHVVDAWVQSHLIQDRDPCFFCTNTHKCIQHVNMHFHFSWLYFLLILRGSFLFYFILFLLCISLSYQKKNKKISL